MSTKKDWNKIFSVLRRFPDEQDNEWIRRLVGFYKGEYSFIALKTGLYRYRDEIEGGTQNLKKEILDTVEYFERRNNDGSVEIKDTVDKKLTDEEIFQRYGRSPLDWRISMVWFKDKSSGGYIMSCCFIPLKNKQQAEVLNELKEDLKNYAPKYPKVIYKNNFKEPVMLEISIYDLHYAKLCWHEESGKDYDTKIAEQRFNDALKDLISRAVSVYNIEKILFVFGNDFFNSEGKSNATTAGTPQDTDSRWQKMFTGGRKLLVKGIETLAQVAPVEAIGIYGNHANQAEFYLGDAIECWFHNCMDVNVNNKPTARKYFLYGNTLIGLTHGNLEKENDLPLLMASEVPEWWSKAKYREFHRGDKHHERIKVFNTTVENKTVVLRTLCSMSGTDAWHTGQGYVGQRQSAQSFAYGKDNGLRATYYYNVQ